MTEITNKLRGETPFPEGGEGVVLRYRNFDLVALQKEFGDQWFMDAGQRMDRWDMPFIQACVKHGAKGPDGKPVNINFDELDVVMLILAERILDALYTSMFGETFQQHIQRVGAALANMTDDINRPLASPENTSSTSGERPSGRGSGRKSSGNSSRTKLPNTLASEAEQN